MRQHRSDGIDRPHVGVVVVIDRRSVDRTAGSVGVHLEEMRVHLEEMRVHLPGKGVVRVIGIGMDVLKRREEKRQQHGQNGLDGCGAAHIVKVYRASACQRRASRSGTFDTPQN